MLTLLPFALALPATLALAPVPPLLAQDGDTVAAVQEEASAGLFPLATKDLVFDPDHTLAQLTQEYARVTGQSFMASEETKTFLDSVRVGLSPGVVVPPARVQETYEQVMVNAGFVLNIASATGPRIFSVDNLNTGNRTTLRSKSHFVLGDDLDMARSHPAVLFTTSVHLPHIDVRQVSNSMRTMITDANTQQMLPGGNTSSMLLTGFGPSIYNLARTLKRMDDEARMVVEQRESAGRLLIERFELRNAVAADCPALLAAILGPEGGDEPSLPQGSRVVADQRTNSLLVRASAVQMPDFKRAIMLLDAKSE